MRWGSGWGPGGGRAGGLRGEPFPGEVAQPEVPPAARPLVGWKVCPGGGQREGPGGARGGGGTSPSRGFYL